MSIEVILKEHVETPGPARRDRQGRRRVHAQLPAAPQAGPRGHARKQAADRREKAKAEARDAGEIMEAQALASRRSRSEIAIARRVGDQDTLFGSVTSADIAEALAARGCPSTVARSSSSSLSR